MERLQVNKYSLIILKPDFLELNLFAELKIMLKEKQLQIIATLSVSMDLEFIKDFYQWKSITYEKEINEYLCSIPMPTLIIFGKNVIMETINIKQKLRQKYSPDILHTLIHSPDSHDDFIREYKLIKSTGSVMKTNNQVEVIVFKTDSNECFRYLMLKRVPRKGDFWQPITGNVEIEESFEQAAVRELREETGIIDFIRIFNTGYSFNFSDDNRQQHEKVFAIEISQDTKITLSEEHSEYQWATGTECLTKYLKYPGNLEGLKVLIKKLEIEDEKDKIITGKSGKIV
jgi:ADP-ribose pyrophosphatase YjhB (NUDIX family)/nucleoside diphosphate kinase